MTANYKNMDPDVFAVYQYLLNAPNRAVLIEAADSQIQAYIKTPKVHVLPNTYKWATPLLEVYAHDMEGWVGFVRAIADHFPKRSDERIPVSKVYRRLNGRYDQKIRRQRMHRAADTYVRVYGPFVDGKDRVAYMDLIFKTLALNRKSMLSRLRQESPKGILPHEVMTDACDGYWDAICADIDAGKVPTWDQLKVLHREAVARNAIYCPNAHKEITD